MACEVFSFLKMNIGQLPLKVLSNNFLLQRIKLRLHGLNISAHWIRLYGHYFCQCHLSISNITKIYKDMSSVPMSISASLVPGYDDNSFLIHSKWKSNDLVKMEAVTFNRDYILSKKNLNVISTSVPSLDSSSISALSKSGNKNAIVTEKTSPDATFLEIWTRTKKANTFDLTESKEHGKINSKTLACMQWSNDEKYLLYTAEAKYPKSVSYFKDTSAAKDDEKTVMGEEFIYKEGWGEQNVGSYHSILCILDVSNGKKEVVPMDKIAEEISVGDAVWGPNNETVIFEGWFESPSRLGIVFCLNRRSALYCYNISTKDIECITSDENCVRSPRFSPDFKTLIYLENDAYGPHVMCSKIKKYDFITKTHSTVIDIVENPIANEFPGIYDASLPKRCWSNDGKYIFLHTAWRSRMAIICVNIEKGQVCKINFDEAFGSCVILDVFNNIIICRASSPNTEPCLVAGAINFKEEISVDWKFLEKPHVHNDLSWEIIALKPSTVNSSYPHLDFEIILLKPKERKPEMSLIVIPHGGPHAVYVPTFQTMFTSLVKLNFVVCLVNYRGSSGFGENSIRSLPGNVGTQDVSDVQDAAKYVKERCGFDINRVFYFGGSHGGFLGAHLAGQFMEFYKAFVLLNPVISLNYMNGVTDIPDWCWVESGHTSKYDPSTVTKPEDLKIMWEVSPIRYVENIKSPILLLIGKNDLRVPPSQGIGLFQHLKARNVPTKLYMYDDCHSLGKPPHESDFFMQTVLWFQKYSSDS